MVCDLSATIVEYEFSINVESWQGMDRWGDIRGRSVCLSNFQYVDFTYTFLNFPYIMGEHAILIKFANPYDSHSPHIFHNVKQTTCLSPFGSHTFFSQCIFNDHSIKIKQNNISPQKHYTYIHIYVYVCVYYF